MLLYNLEGYFLNNLGNKGGEGSKVFLPKKMRLMNVGIKVAPARD
jgi:hypothetical protein